jgi:hypothetical protein
MVVVVVVSAAVAAADAAKPSARSSALSYPDEHPLVRVFFFACEPRSGNQDASPLVFYLIGIASGAGLRFSGSSVCDIIHPGVVFPIYEEVLT